MAFTPLEFTKNWENPEDFPTYEPDETQVRADLQRLHDEAKDGLNRLIAALNSPDAASQLPFVPAEGLTAETVQAAVLEVYAAVREAAAGLLVDGTVTKEKLAGALLDRVYGGRVLVRADTPGTDHDPDADLPVGQLWLQPELVLDNLAGEDWSVSGCTVHGDGTGWTLTADGTSETATAVQLLEGIGLAGQAVLVHLAVETWHDHLTSLTMGLNGMDLDLSEGGGFFETVLDQSGSLEVTLEAVWPYAEADAAVGLSALTVVNTDALAADHPHCEMPADWAAYLQDRLPFGRLQLPRILWQQTAAGQWTEVDRQLLPVDRGGTGRDGFGAGLLLCGSADGGLTQVTSPETAGSLLSFEDGTPKWVTREDVITGAGAVRMKEGTYEGSAADREIDLGCTPKVLFLREGVLEGERIWQGGRIVEKKTHTFVASETSSYEYDCWGYVTVEGSKLKLFDQYENETHFTAVRSYNKSGVTYNWFALY